MKILKLASLCSLAALLVGGVVNAQSQSPSTEAGSVITESGKFRFYETKQPRGEETYEITKSASRELTLATKTELPFAEQDTKPQVSATLRMSADFTPRSFQIKGPTLLEIN
jgi:hypothetical protein